MTHSAAMAAEILTGKTILGALNTDLVCDAINTAMRELFLQIVYGRTQSAFSENGLPISAGSRTSAKAFAARWARCTAPRAKAFATSRWPKGYVTRIGLDEKGEVIGYEFVRLGQMMEMITQKGVSPEEALKKCTGNYGRIRRGPRQDQSAQRVGGTTMAVRFEGYERRIEKINAFCGADEASAGWEEARQICLDKGIDVEAIVKGVQPIAFENAVWAYTLGCANAIKKGVKKAAEAAEAIGEGLQAFCVPGSVADTRKVGLGHGNLAAKLLRRKKPSASRLWRVSNPLPPPKEGDPVSSFRQ